jgi:hypothetical protein
MTMQQNKKYIHDNAYEASTDIKLSLPPHLASF